MPPFYEEKMNLTDKNAILLIDGDNVAASMADTIVSEAKNYGKITETHLFANFKSADSEWSIAAYRHAMRIHHLPVIVAKKNTADIGLTIAAMRNLYSAAPCDVFIIASNDCDFMPVAMEVRNAGKTAVCMYTSRDNTQQLAAYDFCKLVEKKSDGEEFQRAANAVKEILDGCLKSKEKINFNGLSPMIKKKLPSFDVKKDYKKPCSGVKSFIKAVFADYPDKFEKYRIDTDYIEKKPALAIRDGRT